MPTQVRLKEADIEQQYNGRWVLLTDFVRDPVTCLWMEAVVLADAPPDGQQSLFQLAKDLNLNEMGVIFMGENPYRFNFLL